MMTFVVHIIARHVDEAKSFVEWNHFVDRICRDPATFGKLHSRCLNQCPTHQHLAVPTFAAVFEYCESCDANLGRQRFHHEGYESAKLWGTVGIHLGEHCRLPGLEVEYTRLTELRVLELSHLLKDRIPLWDSNEAALL